MLDEIQLSIIATTLSPGAQAPKDKAEDSPQSDPEDNNSKEKLRQALLAKERRAKNQKNSLVEFKKGVEKQVINLIDDWGEWEDFKAEIRDKKRAMRNKSKHGELFLTNIKDNEDFEFSNEKTSP